MGAKSTTKEKISTLKGLSCKIESLAACTQRHLCTILKIYDAAEVGQDEAKKQIVDRMSGITPRMIKPAEEFIAIHRLLDIWTGKFVFVPAIVTRPGGKHQITFPTFKFSVFGMMEVHDLVASVLKNERIPKADQAKVVIEDGAAHLLKKYATPESIWLGERAEWITTSEKDVFGSFRSFIVTANQDGEQGTQTEMVKEPVKEGTPRDDSPAFEDIDCELFEPETVREIQSQLKNGAFVVNDIPESPESMQGVITDAIGSNQAWMTWLHTQIST